MLTLPENPEPQADRQFKRAREYHKLTPGEKAAFHRDGEVSLLKDQLQHFKSRSLCRDNELKYLLPQRS